MAAELVISAGIDNIVVLTGEIDTHTSPLLERHLDGLDDTSAVILDLASVSFISSAGLTAMLTAQTRLNGAGGSLHVQHPTPAVERIIALSGLSELLGSNEAD